MFVSRKAVTECIQAFVEIDDRFLIIALLHIGEIDGRRRLFRKSMLALVSKVSTNSTSAMVLDRPVDFGNVVVKPRLKRLPLLPELP